MLQQQVYVLNAILMALDAMCVVAAGYAAYYVQYYLSGGLWSMDTNAFVASVVLVMFLNNYVLGKFDLYSDRKLLSHLSLIWNIFKGVVVDFVILSTGIFLFRQLDYSRAFLILFAALSFTFIVSQRILSHIYINRVSKNGFNVRKILVVGNQDRAKIVSDVLESQLSWGHEIVGRVAIQKKESSTEISFENTEGFSGVLRDNAIDEVIFAIDKDRSVDLSSYLDICKKMGVPARILPALWKPSSPDLSVEKCQDVPFLTIQGDNFNATGLFYKRILDLAGGLIGTLGFVIMYPFVGAAIKLDSPGPVLFKQQRVGRHGREFLLYKFRSMYQDAEQRKREFLKRNKMQGAMFKLRDDPRITRVGKWLRITSLDESPQFLNVLRGEMSLVGTRPPTPEEVEEYQPWHLRRISAKPGITGLWQVSGRSDIAAFEKVVELDCKYLENWRFADDLKILFKTILTVIRCRGAI